MLRFEQLDGLAGGSGRDAEPDRRRRETARFGHGQEDADRFHRIGFHRVDY